MVNIPFIVMVGASCLAISARETRTLTCLAIGDTCVFVVSDDRFVAFPISRAEDFGIKPKLLGSHHRYNVRLEEHIQTLNLNINDGDLIIMASDAFSKWFLTESQKGSKPWTRFENLDQSGFSQLIRSLRQSKEIRDDDTTAILISIC